MYRNIVFLFAFFSVSVYANPAVEREFHRIVNSDECLKICMKPIQTYNRPLAVFKTSNYTDYFFNLGQICDLITDARSCIDNCKIGSNPFALISVNAICSDRIVQDAQLLESCLSNFGVQVQNQCVEECGDYEEINEQLRISTSTYSPNDEFALKLINEQSGKACAALKCSARCAVRLFNDKCTALTNGKLAGNLIREIVEAVLGSHIMDLKIFGLLESVKNESHRECDYLHTSGVLFVGPKEGVNQIDIF